MIHVGVFSDKSTNVWQAKGFENQGVKVIRYDYRNRFNALNKDIIARDDELIELIKYIKPDFVLFSKCNVMSPRVNKECKRVTKSIMWYMDDKYNINKEFLDKIPYSDYVFTSYPDCVKELSAIHTKVYRLQGGYDPDIHKPIDVPKKYDVAFIGEMRPNRQFFRNHVNFDIINGVYGIDHSMAVSETKINLSFCEGRVISNRIYKLMAAGGFVLTQPYEYLKEDFIIGKHLDIFNGIGELQSKIDFYLKNDDLRNEIANNGLKKVKDYDHNNYAKRILSVVKNGK
jgi:spore maturation protein CgeB